MILATELTYHYLEITVENTFDYTSYGDEFWNAWIQEKKKCIKQFAGKWFLLIYMVTCKYMWLTVLKYESDAS